MWSIKLNGNITYTIRLAKSTDLLFISQIELRALPYENRAIPLGMSLQALYDLWRNRYGSGKFHIIVAESQETIIGFAAILAPKRKEGFIQAIYVDPPYHHCGVGSKLVLASEQVFNRQECPRVKLYVEPMNYNGIKFYKKVGFSPTGQKFRHLNIFLKEFRSC